MPNYRTGGYAARPDGYKRDTCRKEWYKEEEEKPEWDDEEEECPECEKREEKKECKKPICTVVCPFKVEVKILPCDDCQKKCDDNHKKCDERRRPM